MELVNAAWTTAKPILAEGAKDAVINKSKSLAEDIVNNPTKVAAKGIGMWSRVKAGAGAAADVFDSFIVEPIAKQIVGFNTVEDLSNAAQVKARPVLAAWKKEQLEKKRKADEQWNREHPNPSSSEKKQKKKQDKEWEKQHYLDERRYTNELFDKIKAELIKEQGHKSMDDLVKEKQDEYVKPRQEAREQAAEKRNTAAGFEFIDKQVRDWMGATPEGDPHASMLLDYAGGTQITKVLKNIKDINTDPKKSWRNTDLSNITGAAAEIIGKMHRDDEGSKWSPWISAGISAGKKFLGVTNPWLGAAMDIGTLLATTPAARKAAGMVGKGIASAAKSAWETTKKLFKGKDPALMHNDHVIPIHPPPPPPKPIDYSGINIPNLLPQESNAEYMMRMTGGMNVGPANANVVSYSGYRKPQYEKTANRVMMAPPRAATKRVKVRRRKA